MIGPEERLLRRVLLFSLVLVVTPLAPMPLSKRGRGTAEQWIKEGKQAAHWTRLSCHRFRANEVRLLLGVIAYNLGNLLRRLVLPRAIQSWSLTSLQQRLFKTGGRVVRHARYFILQLAESHLTPRRFGQILGPTERLAGHPT